jgi:hypothetical protein
MVQVSPGFSTILSETCSELMSRPAIYDDNDFSNGISCGKQGPLVHASLLLSSLVRSDSIIKNLTGPSWP